MQVNSKQYARIQRGNTRKAPKSKISKQRRTAVKNQRMAQRLAGWA